MKKSILFLCALAFAVSGCDKEEEPSLGDLGTIKVEIFCNDQLEAQYGFDDQNRIRSISWYNEGEKETGVLNYNEEGELVSQMFKFGKEIITRTIRKEGNKIYIGDEGEMVELDAQGRASKHTIIDEGDGIPFYISYEYDAKDNVRKMTETHSDDDDVYTHTYTYDNQKGPLYDCNTPKWFLIINSDDCYQNNILTDVYMGSGYSTPYQIRYEYTYNEQGYAKTRIKKENWDGTWQQTDAYRYEYK